MHKLLVTIGVGLGISFIALVGPWCVIWAINQLAVSAFPGAMKIEFGFWNWLAAVTLFGLSIRPFAITSKNG